MGIFFFMLNVDPSVSFRNECDCLTSVYAIESNDLREGGEWDEDKGGKARAREENERDNVGR